MCKRYEKKEPYQLDIKELPVSVKSFTMYKRADKKVKLINTALSNSFILKGDLN